MITKTFFEKMMVTQLSNNNLLPLLNPKVHHRAHRNPPLGPILSQPNPVRPIDPHPRKVHLNVITMNIYIHIHIYYLFICQFVCRWATG
jgi:hypothetical protein